MMSFSPCSLCGWGERPLGVDARGVLAAGWESEFPHLQFWESLQAGLHPQVVPGGGLTFLGEQGSGASRIWFSRAGTPSHLERDTTRALTA